MPLRMEEGAGLGGLHGARLNRSGQNAAPSSRSLTRKASAIPRANPRTSSSPGSSPAATEASTRWLPNDRIDHAHANAAGSRPRQLSG